jgi:ABC-type branched-subunit amino acid transport system permease subunit
VVFLVWVWGQFPVGHFFNEFLKSIMGFGLILIVMIIYLPRGIVGWLKDLKGKRRQEVAWEKS